MGMEVNSITEISQPEDLLSVIGQVGSSIVMTDKEAELLLRYVKDHDYTVGYAEGRLYRGDLDEVPGEIVWDDYTVDDLIDAVCEWNYEQIYSKCLREGLSDEVIAVIMRDGMDGSQMQVAFEFYQKGVPLETIQSVMDNGENAKHMQKAFEGILANLEKSKDGLQDAGLEKDYVEKLVKQIEEVVAKINHQEERYDELNKKLSVFETARQDKEVHDNLLQKYNDSEAALNSQQEELSRAIRSQWHLDLRQNSLSFRQPVWLSVVEWCFCCISISDLRELLMWLFRVWHRLLLAVSIPITV